jgi:hypothetical protein
MAGQATVSYGFTMVNENKGILRFAAPSNIIFTS